VTDRLHCTRPRRFPEQESGGAYSMIPKSVQRFSEKIMLKQEAGAG
jgi:hypothetical protein